MRVLLIEDGPMIGVEIQRSLKDACHAADRVKNRQTAREARLLVVASLVRKIFKPVADTAIEIHQRSAKMAPDHSRTMTASYSGIYCHHPSIAL